MLLQLPSLLLELLSLQPLMPELLLLPESGSAAATLLVKYALTFIPWSGTDALLIGILPCTSSSAAGRTVAN